MWKRTSNSNGIKPLEIDEVSSQSKVFVRRNFELIPASEGETEETQTPEHWEYDEWVMSKEQYEVYKVMKSEQDEQADAILELADIVGGML